MARFPLIEQVVEVSAPTTMDDDEFNRKLSDNIAAELSHSLAELEAKIRVWPGCEEVEIRVYG